MFDAARAGDETALAAIDVAMDYLSLGLQIISAVVDPEVYVLGGGASASADMFLDSLRAKYEARAFPASRATAIEVASLGNDAGIFGAAYVRCAPPLARSRLSAAVVLPLRLRAAGGYERFSCHVWSL